MRCFLCILAGLLLFPASASAQKTREEKVREDKVKVESDGYWIYNNFSKAREEARRTGKPIFVVLRCIPCEECVKLDDELVDKNPVVRPLLDKYVRVRIVSTNGLDLSLFQFDFDQSFACFLLNADGTIYGRFGTRSHRTEWIGDVSIDGLAKALKKGLELHDDYPANKAALSAKRGVAPLFSTPEKFPSLNKYTSQLNYRGNVVQSCIHCHQVGDAHKDYYRRRNQIPPDDVLFPYPHPKSVGLILDPQEIATVKEVGENTPARWAGFQPGDRIRSLNGQPLLSIADVQWVLHRADPKGARIRADMIRGERELSLTLNLEKGWREVDDISWRVSSWGLRRMVTAGMKLESIKGPRPVGVPEEGMALRVAYTGQHGGPHGAAKAAGVEIGDILVSFDNRTDLQTETEVFTHAMRSTKVGARIRIKVVRRGRTFEYQIPMQQ